MAFSDTQSRQLKAKLDSQYVKARKENGTVLHYIEGWHAIAEANRIFGFDAWDRRTLVTHCVWTGTIGPNYLAAYTAKVRIRVRAGEVIIIREGSGTGEGKAPTPGQAHEIALKSAETDATKRALATFGNAFGLALYDRQQSGVRHRADKIPTHYIAQGPWTLLSATGATLGTFAVTEKFDKALRQSMVKADSIESLFAVWEHNIGTVRALNHAVKHNANPTSDFAKGLVDHLKSCAVALVKPRDENRTIHSEIEGSRDQAVSNVPREKKIDKSALSFGEPKRHRSKEHLRFVASQPCLVCGRVPSQAHHIRFAQSKGLALKVSDEFTVPLCAIHHNENHRTGNERPWWSERKIDPLAAAKDLWKQSSGGSRETSS